MARDSVTIDILTNTRDADRDLARIRKELEKLGASSGKAFKGFGGAKGGAEKVRALGTGLSKATVRADEFTKSLEASNARVVAFGASAGIIMQIDRAFKGMVSSTLKVEKALLDVNVVLNESQKNIKKFGQGMFQVGKQTAQGFDVVAEAATELARQGLGMERTLARTKDALILTRLTGMDAAEAVKSLTAAVNSFNKEGVTSAQVINKMAKVDAAFAVSSDDLAKAISRVGASAVSAGVSMDELLAITTAVQQRTARGGAVIGNAFKTIFTRLQRKDVLQNLRNLGIAVTDFNGEALSGIQVLQNLAGGFSTLSKATQAQTAEQVAGVFQVNILKAAMADLSSTTSNYGRALRTANSATNEAYLRNEQLNQSLDALVNRTMTNLTQAGSSLGGATLEPAIRRTLGFVNGALESFGDGGALENFGKNWGKGIMQGLGDFIAGPGLIVITATVGKLFYNLTKFTGKAFADIMNINKASQQRQGIQAAIVQTLGKEPAILQSVLNKDTSILSLEQQILTTLKAQTLERAAMNTIAAPIARGIAAKGGRIGRSGGLYMGASGFVPNFASAGAERAGAAAGGYKAGAIRTMTQPGGSRIMYNSAETVKRFPGMSQSAIMPPKSSPAGANYKTAFGAAHGFNPYAAKGFVPNFAAAATVQTLNRTKGSRTLAIQADVARSKGKAAPVNLDVAVDIAKMRDIGVITEEGTNSTPIMFSQQALGPKGIPALQKMLPRKMFDGKDGKTLNSLMLRMSPIPAVPIFPFSEGTDQFSNTVGEFPSLKTAFNDYARDLSRNLFPNGKARSFNMKALSKGTEGDIFEEGLRAAVSEQSLADRSAAFDYNGKNYASSDLIKFINKRGGRLKPKSKIEAKIGTEAAINGNIPKKVVNDALSAGMNVGPNIKSIVKAIVTKYEATAGGSIGVLNTTGKAPTRSMNKALGHIPNFAVNPLTNAIGRELSAGVPSSAIRVGSNNSLVSSANPGGLGVYNTIHEPAGLSQGITRSRVQGMNPKAHGIPNFNAGAGVYGGVKNTIDYSYGQKRPLLSPTISSMSTAQPGAMTGSVDVSRYQQLDKGLSDAGRAAKDSAKASAEATKQTRRMGAAMGGMMAQMALGAAAAQMEEGSSAQTLTAGAGSIAGYAGMGYMMGGGLGALAGAGLGILGTGIEMIEKHSAAAAFTMETLSKKLQETQSKTAQVSETISGLGTAIGDLSVNDPGKRRAAGRSVTEKLDQLSVQLAGTDAGKNVEKMIDKLARKGQFMTVKDFEALSQQAEKENQKNLRQAALDVSFQGVKVRNQVGTVTQDIADGNKGRAMETLFSEAIASTPNANNAAVLFQNVFSVGQGRNGDIQDIRGRSQSLNRRQRAAENTPRAFNAVMGTKTIDDPNITILQALLRSDKAKEILAGMEGGAIAYDPQTRKPITTFTDMAFGPSGAQRRSFLQDGGGFQTGLEGAFQAAGIKEDIRKKLKDELNTPESREVFMQMLFGRGVADVSGGPLSSRVKGRAANKYAPTTVAAEGRRGQITEGLENLAVDEPKAAAKIGARATRAFTEGLRKASVASKNQLRVTKLEIAQSVKLRKVQNDYDIALAKATKDTLGVADEKLAQALKEAAINFKDASKLAKETFNSQMATDMAAFAKQFEKTAEKFDKGAFGKAVSAFDPVTKKPLRSNNPFNINGGFGGFGTFEESQINIASNIFESLGSLTKDQLRDRISGVEERERRGTGTLSTQDEIIKEFAPKFLEKLNLRSEELDQKMKELGIANTNARTNAEKQLVIDKKMFEVSRMFNANKANELAITKRIVEQKKLEYFESLRDAGKMGASEVVAQRDVVQRNRMRTKGITPEDLQGAFGQGFKGGMTYDEFSLFDDLKEGGADVATSMKSSFADAFKSIASGATDAKGAIAQFADGILNTISDITAKIGTNMLFSRLGMAQGGFVPGYNKGGIVTGGSGYKDDVPAMMNSGEFVIKKSSAQKIGYGTLNAINSGETPGYSMGGMFAISAGASAMSGLINQNKQSSPSPVRGQNYGQGRGAYGYFGGADINATGPSSMSGGSQSAAISLSKGFNFYRRDPATGRLISERSRPTEGGFDVSSALSLQGRLNEGDPQTARMFGREKSMGDYGNYLDTEKTRRKNVMKSHEAKKRGRLMSAYVNAAMLIGGSYMLGNMGMKSKLTGAKASAEGVRNYQSFGPSHMGGMTAKEVLDSGVDIQDSGIANMARGGAAKSSPAMLMGGEYVMSADTVRTHGLGFMNELNRGNVPGYANGGYVGAPGTVGGGINNNVNISVNLDRRGNASVDSSASNDAKENDQQEMQKNKEFGAALQTVVLQEIMKQQRPGGLLQNSN